MFVEKPTPLLFFFWHEYIAGVVGSLQPIHPPKPPKNGVPDKGIPDNRDVDLE